jgi:hypothetical protein
MYQFKYIIRLYWPSVNSRLKLERVVQYLETYRSACDEVCIFTEGDLMDRHSIPLDEYRSRGVWMSEIIRTLKEKGFKTHINIMITYGHYEHMENIDYIPPFPKMKGHNGIIASSIPCPNSAKFKEYIFEKYRIFALCRPDVIWVDDDLRMERHRPVMYGCFCDICMDKFNKLHATSFERESLVNELLKDNYPEENELRAKWLEFNRQTCADTLKIIKEAVHGTDKDIVLGLMAVEYVNNMYSFPDYKLFGEILKNSKRRLVFRCGNGLRDDSIPFSAVYRGINIAYQVKNSIEAEFVSEVEGIPYQTLDKTPEFTAFEISCQLGLGGVSGLMLNLMDGMGNDWTEQVAYLDMAKRKRPFFKSLSESLQGHRQLGFYPYLNQSMWAYNDTKEDLYGFDDLGTRNALKLIELGIPLSHDPDNNLGTIISGKTAKTLSEEQIEELCKKDLYVDGTAAKIINEKKGHTKIFGVECINIPSGGVYEKFTDDKLNGIYNGYNRDSYIRNNMFVEEAIALKSKGAKALTEIFDYDDKNTGFMGTAIHCNSFGGKNAVMGFSPWIYINFLHKRYQITEVLDWISGGKLPVKVKSPYKIALALWEGDRDVVIPLYNISFQPVKELKLWTVYNGKLSELGEDGVWKKLPAIENGLIGLECFKPWSTRVLKIKK